MSFFTNPAIAADYYKIAHPHMQPPGTTRVYSTWTARSNKHHPGCEKTVVFGYQYTIRRFFIDFFEENFFSQPIDALEKEFRDMMSETFDSRYGDFERFRKLHELGFLPIDVWGLPEGSIIPIGVPDHVIFNTHPDFAWLPQYLEDIWSANNWMPSTSATTAYYRRRILAPYVDKTCDNPSESLKHMCGDFSMRGHTSIDAAAISGAAHALSFDRTATILSNALLKQYYSARPEDLMRGTPSLEHSVVEQGVAWMRNRLADGTLPDYTKKYVKEAIKDNWEVNLVAEMCFLLYLLVEVQPKGVMTYVSDTYDYWGVVSKILPLIKPEILMRNGVLSVRPDSGDPYKIICGDKDAEPGSPEFKGTMGCLFEIFGYTKNQKGCSILPSNIRMIYGDAITAHITEDVARDFYQRGWSLDNICFGIGAYTYQYVTRDTRGYAIKATECFHEEYGETAIFKSPKTAAWKKSLKGCACIYKDPEDEYRVVDNMSFNEAFSEMERGNTAYIQQFHKGVMVTEETFEEIHNRFYEEEAKDIAYDNNRLF